MNKNKSNLIDAYNKGYHVVSGSVIYKGNKLNPSISATGYHRFSIRNKDGNSCDILVHRLAAYQKYGNEIFNQGVQVRHKNSNPLDNSDENLILGTAQQNSIDSPPAQRSADAGNASRKHNHADIIKLHKKTGSYNIVMNQFGISSRGTLNYILRKSAARVANKISN